jgi:transposase-like protein
MRAERMLSAELNRHLANEEEGSKNHRNGSSPKKVLMPGGALNLTLGIRADGRKEVLRLWIEQLKAPTSGYSFSTKSKTAGWTISQSRSSMAYAVSRRPIEAVYP